MKHINTLKNKKGMALLTVMLIFFVLSILLAGLVSVTNSNLKQSVVTKNHTAAFYASEAGITKVSTDFEKKLNELKDQNLSSSAFLSALTSYINTNINTNPEKTINLENNNGETSKAIITLTNEGVDAQGYSNYKLSSKGYVGNLERTLVKTYRFKYTQGTTGNGFKIDKAILTTGKMIVDGVVTGAPVATYSKDNNVIEFDWSGKAPGVEIPTNTNSSQLIKLPNNDVTRFITGGTSAIKSWPAQPSLPAISMPNIPNVNFSNNQDRLNSVIVQLSSNKTHTFIDSNGSIYDNSSGNFDNYTYTLPDSKNKSAYYVPRISINGNSGLTINVTKDTTLVVDELYLKGNLRLTGNGTLTIFVRPSTSNGTPKVDMDYGGAPGWVGNKTDPKKLLIYVDKVFTSSSVPTTVTIGSGATYYFSLLAMNLNFKIEGGAFLDGYLVTDGLTVDILGGSNANSTLYYAPKAQFTIKGGANVTGAVIADKVTITGGASLKYEDVDFSNFPFQINVPFGGTSGSSNPKLELIKGSTIEQ